MKFSSIMASASLILAALVVTPATADPGRGHHGRGHDNSAHHWHENGRKAHRARVPYMSHCPPGLAKKSPACVPPGQARKHERHYGHRIGEILRHDRYIFIRDPGRYDLPTRKGWRYYRDDRHIYRVDSATRQILSVLNLINALAR